MVLFFRSASSSSFMLYLDRKCNNSHMRFHNSFLPVLAQTLEALHHISHHYLLAFLSTCIDRSAFFQLYLIGEGLYYILCAECLGAFYFLSNVLFSCTARLRFYPLSICPCYSWYGRQLIWVQPLFSN